MRSTDFTKIQNKILAIGLDSFEIAAYLAIASHGGTNSRGIYPSWPALQKLTLQSRGRLWKSMNGLRELGVIEWDRGKTGIANTYYLTKVGTWRSRSSSPGELPPVRVVNQGSSPRRPPVVRHVNPNQMQLNQMQEPEVANAPMTKADAKKRFDEIFSTLGGRPE